MDTTAGSTRSGRGDGEYAGYAAELVGVVSAAVEALRGLPGVVHRLTGPDLDTVLAAVDRVAALAGAARFTVTADAVARGEVAASQAGSTRQWVAERCPSLDAREAGVVAKAVRDLTGAHRGALDLTQARDAVMAGSLSVPAGAVLATEWGQLKPLVEPGAREAVVAGLVAMGESEGPVGVRAVRPALLARYGLGEVLQEVEDRQAGLTTLSCGADIGGGVTEYRLRLAVEARAVLEAALNAASAPQPLQTNSIKDPGGSGGGLRDPRTVEQRRGDALIAACRRATTLYDPTLDAGTSTTVNAVDPASADADGIGTGTVRAGGAGGVAGPGGPGGVGVRPVGVRPGSRPRSWSPSAWTT